MFFDSYAPCGRCPCLRHTPAGPCHTGAHHKYVHCCRCRCCVGSSGPGGGAPSGGIGCAAGMSASCRFCGCAVLRHAAKHFARVRA